MFDVFLAHNSEDKPIVREVASKLKRRGLRPWIDEEQFFAGNSIQKVIQDVIPSVGSAVIFIGPNGLGSWHEDEAQLLLDTCKKQNKPIFLVLLPGIEKLPNDLGFLNQRYRVSLETEKINYALDKIESGIKGRKVSPFSDVLLCYKQENAIEVRCIEKQLKEAGISVWKTGLNSSSLQSSVLGQLQKDFARIRSLALFIGDSGGPWESEIISDIILDFRESRRPVIPTLLKDLDVEKELDLPIYFRRVGRVDFRITDPDPVKRLLLGITGEDRYK